MDLLGLEMAMASAPDRAQRLRRALEPLDLGDMPEDQRFTYVLIDCPPRSTC